MEIKTKFKVNESQLVILHMLTIIYDSFYFNIPQELEEDFRNLITKLGNIVDSNYPDEDIINDELLRIVSFKLKD